MLDTVDKVKRLYDVDNVLSDILNPFLAIALLLVSGNSVYMIV